MPTRITNITPLSATSPRAVRRIVDAEELDYLAVSLLNDLDLPRLAGRKANDPRRGPDSGPHTGPDIDTVESFGQTILAVCPALYLQPHLKIVTDAGATNPRACAAQTAQVLCDNGSGDLPLGVVSGDNLFDRLEELLAAGCSLENQQTGQPLSELRHKIVSAHARLGAKPVATALAQGSRLVVAGRVDPRSLLVAPRMFEQGKHWFESELVRPTTLAAQILAAGARLTLSPWQKWREAETADPTHPIGVLEEDSIQIRPLAGSRGVVSLSAVQAQLLAGCNQQGELITPEVAMNINEFEINSGSDGAISISTRPIPNKPPIAPSSPEGLNASLGYQSGFAATLHFEIRGGELQERANAVEHRLKQLFKQDDCDSVTALVEVYQRLTESTDTPESDKQSPHILRVELDSENETAIKQAFALANAFIKHGTQDTSPLNTHSPQVRPTYATWPTSVPKSSIEPNVEVRPATDWL